jgi:hypothetical protein
VSTAVYDVGDEIEIGPEDFSHLAADGDVFESPEKPSFVDEVTKAEIEDVMQEPQVAAPAPAPEPQMPEPPVRQSPPEPEPVTPAPAAATPFDEPSPPGYEEPTIEFMTDDGDGDLPPPSADMPSPAERYIDRIVAPSPFAPRDAAKDGGIVGWTDEDSAALADLTQDIVVDESSDNAIEVPLDNGLEEPVPPMVEEGFAMDDGDPFADRDPEPEPVERAPAAAIESAKSRDVAVRAEDNQLHLRLHGTGAIIESGQVRELDIEVPVPGAWVGHRRVTLQLRLTLTPDSEEENGGSGETS